MSTSRGWTIFGKLRSTPTRSGVLFEGTPLRVKMSSSCKRPMQPTRVYGRMTHAAIGAVTLARSRNGALCAMSAGLAVTRGPLDK